MHELGLTQGIVDTVIQAAKDAGAHRIRSVYLTIGEIRDVVDELFLNCFDFFSKGTIAEGAQIVITRMPLMVRCKSCGFAYHIDIHDESSFHCPACGEKQYALTSGMEFYIGKIEIA